MGEGALPRFPISHPALLLSHAVCFKTESDYDFARTFVIAMMKLYGDPLTLKVCKGWVGKGVALRRSYWFL